MGRPIAFAILVLTLAGAFGCGAPDGAPAPQPASTEPAENRPGPVDDGIAPEPDRLTQPVSTFAPTAPVLFGPERFTPAGGAAVRTVEAGDDAGDATIVVRQADGRRGGAEVLLDGRPVVRASELGPRLHEVSRPVVLGRSGSLEVRASGPAGSGVDVTVVGRAYPIRGVSATVVEARGQEPPTVLVRATLKLRNPFTVPSVSLERVDADGRVLSVEGTLQDDGDEAHGDDVSSDGTFSLLGPLAATGQPAYFRVRVERDGVAEVSRVFTVDRRD